MPALVATILGSALIAAIFVSIEHRMLNTFVQHMYEAEIMQAASQQFAFATGAENYIKTYNPAEGTVIDAQTLISFDTLNPYFPATNPLGQTPEVIVGANQTAIITYTAVPAQSVLNSFNMNSASKINLEALALDEADDIAAMQEGLPQFAGGMLNAGTLTTPLQTLNAPASNYLGNAALPTGPIFADLMNILPVPTSTSAATGGYSSVSGD